MEFVCKEEIIEEIFTGVSSDDSLDELQEDPLNCGSHGEDEGESREFVGSVQELPELVLPPPMFSNVTPETSQLPPHQFSPLFQNVTQELPNLTLSQPESSTLFTNTTQEISELPVPQPEPSPELSNVTPELSEPTLPPLESLPASESSAKRESELSLPPTELFSSFTNSAGELSELPSPTPESPAPFANVAVKLEPGVDVTSIQVNTGEILAVSKKRKLPTQFYEFEVSSANPRSHNVKKIRLKHCTVNIGPKLPLPLCFQRPMLHKHWSKQNIPNRGTSPNTKPIKVKIFSCPHCNLKSTDSDEYDRHIVSCQSRSFASNKSANSSFDKKDVFFCRICYYRFRDVQNLIAHENKHDKSKRFQCKFCNHSYFLLNDLRDHYKDTHTDIKPELRLYSCTFCDYSTKMVNHMKEHVIKHNVDRNIYCYVCRRNVEDEEEVEYHEHKVGGKSRRITVQGNVDTKTPTLQNTNNTSRDDNSDVDDYSRPRLESLFDTEIIKKDGFYYCNGCSYKFIHLANLNTHKKEHLSVSQPLQCLKCPFKTFSTFQLREHGNLHRDHYEKFFKCNVCELQLSNYRKFRYHMVDHVYDELYCRMCMTNSETFQEMQLHMAEKHAIFKLNYRCKKCSFSTHSKLSIRKHEKKHLQTLKPKISDRLSRLSIKRSNQETPEQTSKLSNHQGKESVMSQKSIRSYFTEEPCERNKSFECKKCHYVCFDFKQFEHHDRNKHTGEKEYFTCNKCLNKFKQVNDYIQHLKCHPSPVFYSCQYCDYCSCKKEMFLKHLRVHRIKSCPMCTFTSFKMEALKQHLNTGHNTVDSAVAQHVVNSECSSANPSVKVSLSSRSLDVSIKPHACSTCDYRCKRSHDMKRHEKRHQIRPVNKNQMNTKYSYRFEISFSKEADVNSSDPKEESSENVSEERFSNEDSKGDSVEMTEDTQNVRYHCTICQFDSVTLRKVYSHLQSAHHTSGGIRNSMVLKSPMIPPQDVHQHSDSSTTIIKRKRSKGFSCSKCGFTTKHKSSMWRHGRRFHGNKSLISVINTKTLSSKIKSSNVNILNVHKFSNLYSCSECDFKSRKRNSIARHLKHAHKTSGGVRRGLIIKQCPTNVNTEYNVPYSNNGIESGGAFTSITNTKIEPDSTDERAENNVQNLSNSINNTRFFSCAKCEFKAGRRGYVERHLKRVHNTYGGVRKGLIIKCDLPNQKTESEVTDSYMALEMKVIDTDESSSKNKIEHNLKVENEIQNNSYLFSCSKCEYTARNRRCVARHLKQVHKTYGGVRKGLIIKYDLPNEEAENEVPNSDIDLEMKAMDIDNSSKTKIDSNDKNVMQNNSFLFSCSKCEYKARDKMYVSRHLRQVHKTYGGVRKGLVIKYDLPKAENEVLDSDIDLEMKAMDIDNSSKTKIEHNLKIENEVQNNSYLFSCSKCEYTARNRKYVARHLRQVHKAYGGVRKGLIIKYDLPNKEAENEVPNSDIDLEMKAMDIDNSCKTKAGIDLSDRNEMPNNLYLFSCSKCEFKAKRRGYVAQHLKKVHKTCGGVRLGLIIKQEMPNEINETNHSTADEHEVKLQQTDNTIIQNKNSLSAQIQKCSDCNVGALSTKAQRLHTRLGHKRFWKLPFSCSVCGLRFTSKSGQVNHMAMHKEAKFSCDICGQYKTYRKDILNYHKEKCILSQIEEEVENNSDEESYSCGECNFVTDNVTDLSLHMFTHCGIPDD